MQLRILLVYCGTTYYIFTQYSSTLSITTVLFDKVRIYQAKPRFVVKIIHIFQAKHENLTANDKKIHLNLLWIKASPVQMRLLSNN